MNPRIAELSELYPYRPAADKEWAVYATADPDGTYRVFVLTPSRFEWWLAMEWERRANLWQDQQMAVD